MEMTFSNIKVSGIATALPKERLDLMSLSPLYGEMEVKRIMASTGITHVAVASSTQKASDFCYEAAKVLFSELKINPKTVDAIIFVSQTPDARLPATSAILQNRLSLHSRALAFDINYGCSGYIYGLLQASILIQSGACQRVLLCAGDTITHHLNPASHSVRLVFGDAGSATLIEKGDDQFSFAIYTDGTGADKLRADVNEYLYMDGQAIMEFALREVPPCIEKVIELKKWKKEEVDSYVLHQANQFMLNYLRKKMQVHQDAVPITVKETGNTGPASIPLALTLDKDRLQSENRLTRSILCGFGVGLSWGAVGLDLSKTILLPPVEISGETQELFEEETQAAIVN